MAMFARLAWCAPGEKLWEFDTGQFIGTKHSPAVGADGTVYIGTRTTLQAVTGKMWAIDGKTGAKKWDVPTGWMQTSPAIGLDGRVIYAHAKALAPYPDGRVTALNPSGAASWEYTNCGYMDSFNGECELAIGRDGTVYFGSRTTVIPGEEYRPEFYALNGANGGKMQTRSMGETGRFQGATAIATDGTVFIWDAYSTKFLALDGATLTEKWHRIFDDRSSSPAIGSDGTVYVASFNLFALNGNTGTTNWEFKLPGSPGAPGRISTEAAIGPDGTIYVGGGLLYAINPNGTKKWEYLLPNVDGVIGAPAVAADGTVYFGSGQGKLFAMDGQTGARKWVFAGGDGYKWANAPIIGSDGTVYFVVTGSSPGGGKLYAIEGTAPLANSAWPKYRQNLSNTGLAGTNGPSPTPKLNPPRLEQGKVILSWDGDFLLLRALKVDGPWEEVLNPLSPFTIIPTREGEYFRLKQKSP